MKSLFDPADRAETLARLDRLGAAAPRQWGTMDAAQMLAHCTAALEMACGEGSGRQAWIGKLLMPFFRKKLLGETPFQRDSPTGKRLVVTGPREFLRERDRLREQIDRFVARGPEAAGSSVHEFFGRLSGEEWGRLMHKHLDHHLRQFGV